MVRFASEELAGRGLASRNQVIDSAVARQPKAYPVDDDSYQRHLRVIRAWRTDALPNPYPVRPNGMHKCNNHDHSMMTALIVARRMAGVFEHDPWRVDADAEYLEERDEGTAVGARSGARRASGARAG